MIETAIKQYIKKHSFLILAAIFGFAFWVSIQRLPGRATVFPRAVLLYIYVPVLAWNLIHSVVETVRTLPSEKSQASGRSASKSPRVLLDSVTRQQVATLFLTFVLLIGFAWVGMFVSSVVYLAAVALFLGSRSVKHLLLFVLLMNAGLYLVFVLWIDIRLPSGLLF